MKKISIYIILAVSVCGLTSLTFSEVNRSEVAWGFYAHRLINRLAVFTLPPELIVLYKENINYVSEHAVDPDKRRYSTPFEAVRHYIDIDHWGEPPFDNLPRKWNPALAKFTVLSTVLHGDTIELFNFPTDKAFDVDSVSFQLPNNMEVNIDKEKYLDLFRKYFLNQYYSDIWVVDSDSFFHDFPMIKSMPNFKIYGYDRLSPYGINPYWLKYMQSKLRRAFEARNIPRILRYSAEMGHYIADAHVPLHTTENYDGDMTGQDGIHAFWESRIPELFSDNFDFFVGKAEYIENKTEYFWNIILESHSYVDSVLLIEKRLRATWDKSEIYCYDERSGRIVRIECEAYAAAYNKAMDGMVESRLRKAIKSVGSSWYTAWVDAGQPQLSSLSDTIYHFTADPIIAPKSKKFQIRVH